MTQETAQQMKGTDPKIKDDSTLTKAQLFIEAIRLSQTDKKQEEDNFKQELKGTYYLLQEIALEEELLSHKP